MDKFVKELIERVKKTPDTHLPGYMERYWVTPFDENGSNTRIHHILRSDTDRHMHCHPWKSTSIILDGGYWESMPADQGQPAEYDEEEFTILWRGPGSVVQREAHHRHKLTLPPKKTCWTLFITGPYERKWGFHTPEGFVYHRDYLAGP